MTAEYCLGLYRYHLRLPEETGLRLFMRDIRSLFDMTHRVQIPKEYRAITQEVRTPFIRDITMRVTASLTKDPPVLSVEPRDDTVQAKEAAAIAGTWTSAVMDEMDRAVHENIRYTSALHLVRDSESVVKCVHRPDAWANFPVRDDEEPATDYLKRADHYRKGRVIQPFAWRVVDRAQMLFGDGEYGDEWALEYGEYPLPYLDRRFLRSTVDEVSPETRLGGRPYPEAGIASTGLGLSTATSIPTANNLAGRALKLEYWDAWQWAVVVNGKMAPGFPKPNPYCPMLPYQRAVSYPALYALRYLVPAVDACLTMKMNWAYLSAFPVVVMEALAGVQNMLDSLPVGDAGEPPPTMTWRPGRVYFPPSGYTMRFLEPPTTGRDIDEMVKDLRDLIDVAGIPNIMRGISGARQAGYAVNQLMAAAQVSYKKLGEALERQSEQTARFLWNAVSYTIGSPVYVLGEGADSKKWVGLQPTGRVTQELAPVDDLGTPKVTFRPVLPTDEQAEAMIAMQLVNAPKQLVSHEYALKHYLQVEDPQSMMDDIAVEDAMRQEPLKSQVLISAMRKAGMPVPAGMDPSALAGPPGGNGTVQPNDQTNAGEPGIPGLTQLIRPGPPEPTSLQSAMGQAGLPTAGMREGEPPGGRPAGAYPGEPAQR